MPAAGSSTSARPRCLRHRVRSYFSEDKLADVKTGTLISRSARHRLHPGRQRKGSAGARKQPHQAVQAALQHPAARRQDVPVHQADARTLSARLRHAAPAQGRRHLFRPLLPGQPGAPAGALHPSPFPGAVLQGGPDALSPQAVPAIPHSPLPGAVRGGPDHRRSLRRRGARRAPVPGRPAHATWRAICARAWRRPPRRCASRRPPRCATC